VTTVPWAMVFPRAGDLPRHPSQLYEAASEGILLFVIMQFCLAMGLHRRRGLITAIFFLGYGSFRFICEFFREPDAPFLGPVSMGMALSIPIWLAAGALFVISLRPTYERA
jgi:phosphatidylglycerol:prolipoprotein diacylglycerol transferase